MKILLAIQGTGNGHMSRAQEIYPELKKYGDVDVLISGVQFDVQPTFPLKYKMYGVSLIFGHHGGVDIWRTFLSLKPLRFVKDIRKLPIREYDMVISDFEPISAWACKLRNKPCVALSRQYALLNRNIPAPRSTKAIGRILLRQYAPSATGYGFNFIALGENIFTPLIRRHIRELTPTIKAHYTVYLPAYSDAVLVRHLSKFPAIRWEVFSKHTEAPSVANNISIHTIQSESFSRSIAACQGVICGAGFETIAEAIHLGKKILVIPMRMQYEQYCNSHDASALGATTIKKLGKKQYTEIENWLHNSSSTRIVYPDSAADLVKTIMEDQAIKKP